MYNQLGKVFIIILLALLVSCGLKVVPDDDSRLSHEAYMETIGECQEAMEKYKELAKFWERIATKCMRALSARPSSEEPTNDHTFHNN